MADCKEGKKSTRQLITSLCRALLSQSIQTRDISRINNPLKVPRVVLKSSKEEDKLIKNLFNIAYDLIILRTNEWRDRWTSPLSPDLRCLSHVFHLSNDKERTSLTDSVTVLTPYEYSQLVFSFLSNLANLPQKVFQVLINYVGMVT